MKARKQSPQEKHILNCIKQQEDKIAACKLKIDEYNQQLAELLLSPEIKPPPQKVDEHEYCGKIPYPSRDAAKKARKLINRDLRKVGKECIKRAYYCQQCEAWHLTTIAEWTDASVSLN